MSASRAFRRDVAAMDELFAFTSDAFGAEGIDQGLRPIVDLVLEELFTNVVKYGRKSEAAVRVELSRTPGGVVPVYASLSQYTDINLICPLLICGPHHHERSPIVGMRECGFPLGYRLL